MKCTAYTKGANWPLPDAVLALPHDHARKRDYTRLSGSLSYRIRCGLLARLVVHDGKPDFLQEAWQGVGALRQLSPAGDRAQLDLPGEEVSLQEHAVSEAHGKDVVRERGPVHELNQRDVVVERLTIEVAAVEKGERRVSALVFETALH